MSSRGERRWRRLGENRQRRRADHLDALLTATAPIDDDLADGPFVDERTVARALAQATIAGADTSSDPMMAIRAALAARQARQHEAVRRRAQMSLRLGSAAALVAVVMIAVASLSPGPSSPGAVGKAELEATQVLRILNYSIDQVRDSVEDGNREQARERSFVARDAINDTAEAARRLPKGNAVRDKLLEEAYEHVATLQELVTRVQLEVPPLSAPAAATLSTTSTTAPPPAEAIAAPPSSNPGGSSSVPSTVVQFAPSTTSPPAPTATTTTRPVEPATTTTTTTSAPSTTTTTRPPTPTTLPPPSTTTTLPPATTTTTSPPPTTTTSTIPPTTTTTKPATPPTTTTTRLGGG